MVSTHKFYLALRYLHYFGQNRYVKAKPHMNFYPLIFQPFGGHLDSIPGSLRHKAEQSITGHAHTGNYRLPNCMCLDCRRTSEYPDNESMQADPKIPEVTHHWLLILSALQQKSVRKSLPKVNF